MRFDELRPYRSYTVARIGPGITLEQAAREVVAVAVQFVEERGSASVVQRQPWEAGNRAGFMHYRVERRPGWTTSADVVDVTNELTVVTAYRSHVAVYSSEGWLKNRILGVLRDRDRMQLTALSLVVPAKLETGLLRDNEQRTLWLSGIHRRTASKADNKVLSGVDLRYALDPLGDQSYSYTAARANASTGDGKEPVGVAPRKSSVWVGVARGWLEHRNTARVILRSIADAEANEQAFLPVLAQPAPEGIDFAELEAPFEAAFIPPENLDQSADDAARLDGERLSRLAIAAEILNGNSIRLRVTDRDQPEELEYELHPDLSDPHRVRWTVRRARDAPDSMAEADELVYATLGSRPNWLKVWFESGYVLSDCSLFRARHRDLPFTGWKWADFGGYDVKKEKPNPLAADRIGHDGSLFCWVANQERLPWAEHRGWLASNDGSMEIADFIHVDPHDAVLTLVHVKGAGSSSTTRAVSVSSYEIVVGQAVKNLRHVDQELLTGGFLQSLDRRLKAAVWHDGEFLGEAGRTPMKDAIRALGTGSRRQVVILQPHVRKTSLESTRQSHSTRTRLRAQQLDTLLLGARASCQSVGAELMVLGDDA